MCCIILLNQYRYPTFYSPAYADALRTYGKYFRKVFFTFDKKKNSILALEKKLSLYLLCKFYAMMDLAFEIEIGM